MKIQIYTENKTIKVEEQVNFKDLLDSVKKLFPNGEWKEYTLETDTEINWTNPIIIDRTQPYIYPNRPWWETQPTICNVSTNYDAPTVLYNVEI